MARFCGFALLNVIAITLLVGCVKLRTPLPKAQMNEPFWIKIENRVQIDRLELAFLYVREDSRCPIDVVCVWEGNAQVELALRTRNTPRVQVVINSNLAPTKLEYEGYQIRYLDLEPRPCTRCRLNPKEYRLKLIVSSLSSS